jgi:putative two-component system response regulator
MSDFPTASVPAPAPSVGGFTAPGNGRAAVRVLVTDDSPVVRAVVERFLTSRGYEVRTAESGAAALELLSRDRFTVMLCDVEMPGMTGVELVPHALRADPELAVIMLSAVDNASTATGALDSGALDYLVKPINPEAMAVAIDRALNRRALLIEQRRVDELVREEVAVRTAELERKKAALSALTEGLAEVLINVMEAREAHLRGHSHRVAELAASIAAKMGLTAEEVEHIRLAGLLHDVGKVAIRESVLAKPGQLTPEEVEHVRGHVRAGAEFLAPVTQLGPVVRYLEEHHERIDGTGYPRGLRGDQISLGGRILGAANAYDALTSARPYRHAVPPEVAVERLSAGASFDPDVCRALREVVAAEGR